MFAVCALRVMLVHIFMVGKKGSCPVGVAKGGPLGPHGIHNPLIFACKQESWESRELTSPGQQYQQLVPYFKSVSMQLSSLQQKMCLPLHSRVIFLKCDVQALGSA